MWNKTKFFLKQASSAYMYHVRGLIGLNKKNKKRHYMIGDDDEAFRNLFVVFSPIFLFFLFYGLFILIVERFF